MRLQRVIPTIILSAGICAAQQNTTGTNDLSNLQHQRLSGTSDQTGATTGTVTGRATNPNMGADGTSVAPNLMDYGAGADQGNNGHFVTMSDKQFAAMLSSRSMIEIQLGTLAEERGSTEAVRQLARHLVEDYTKWSTGIQKASAGLGIKLPNDLDAKHKATVDRVSALSGAEFDAAYLKEMVPLQQKALTIAQYEAANAGVSGFRHWAGVMVPILQGQIKDTKQAMDTMPVADKR